MLTQQLSLLNKAFSEVKYYHFHKSAGYRPTNPEACQQKYTSLAQTTLVWQMQALCGLQ